MVSMMSNSKMGSFLELKEGDVLVGLTAILVLGNGENSFGRKQSDVAGGGDALTN